VLTFATVGRATIVALACGAVALIATGCEPSESKQSDAPKRKTVFTEVAAAAGITYVHHAPVLDRKLDNIMSWVCSVGAAAAAGDFNNDGWIDLYVTDSRKGTKNHLYRNNQDGTFTDVGEAAGVADVNNEGGTSMDCVWGDVDNDGWSDLYVVRWGNDLLFRNNGDGTFTDITAKRFRKRDGSPGTQWANGNAAIFFDYNLDGRLDIYVGNYFAEVDLWHLDSTRIMHDDFEKARNGGNNFLYRQEEDGSFTEIAESLGIDDPGWTLAVGSADLNNDGLPDLYCADDFGPDQLFTNRGGGEFVNVSSTAIGFDTKKGMNVDFGDFNNDGWLDIYVANITTTEYLQEGNMLWHNNGRSGEGDVTFTDISLETGTFDGGWGWGAKFFDYDNDGDLDLFAANGFISAGEGNYWFDLASWTVLGQDTAEARNWPTIGDRSFSGYEAFRFWRNDGFDAFSSQAKDAGLDSDRDGRGVVCFDYDNDGDVDLFIANQSQPPLLYRNDYVDAGHWLTLVLEPLPDAKVNRDGIGTRVTLVTDRGHQLREREGGNGYSGQSDPRIHFGLGDDTSAKLIEIRWPDGGLQYLENVSADQILVVRQDPSQYVSAPQVVVSAPLRRGKAGDDSSAHPAIDPAKLEAILSDAEAQLRAGPVSHALVGAYRGMCVKYGEFERSIEFLRDLAEEHPNDETIHVEFSCAFVDKIPSCGGLAAVVSKGTLANKSLDVLNALIAESGGSWLTYYARGMNHLHWPKMLRHSDDAAEDFKRCIAIQSSDADRASKPYYERTHVLLGDAYAKQGDYQAARKAWRDGKKLFPSSEALAERLKLDSDDAVAAFISNERSLEHPIDTDMSFIERDR
jgi:enediyne biosynthesis protein E4